MIWCSSRARRPVGRAADSTGVDAGVSGDGRTGCATTGELHCCRRICDDLAGIGYLGG